MLRYAGYAAQKEVPYYTRPEDFKVPDYRPAKANLPNGFNQNFVPKFTPVRRPFQPQQFFQNFRPPAIQGLFPEALTLNSIYQDSCKALTV